MNLRSLLKKIFGKQEPAKPVVDVDALVADGAHQRAVAGDPDGMIRSTYWLPGGLDIRFYVSEHRFDKSNPRNHQCIGLGQGLEWHYTPGSNQAHGTLVELNQNGNLPPDLRGKYLTVYASNKLGSQAVIAAFRIEGAYSVSSEVKIDDLAIERKITWEGAYLPEVVGPIT